VYKGFDSATGDVCVGGVEILKIVWSRSIPTTLDKLDTHIRSLFCTESHHHISQLFDVANPFVWMGDDSKFTVYGQSFFLRDIHPLFPRSVCHDFLVSTFPCAHNCLKHNISPLFSLSDGTTNDHIYGCWKFDLGAHAYLSLGAARGEEMTNLPLFKDYGFQFNSLSFQLFSNKGESHGQRNNECVRHHLSPSLSRRILLLRLCLYPFIKRSLQYSLPDNSKIKDAINEMFADMMSLESPVGTKVNRDFMAQIINVIAPKTLNKTSTTEDFSQQFHHSAEIHDTHYSSQTYTVDTSTGMKIQGQLMTARIVWSALGEHSHEIPHFHAQLVTCMNFTKKHYDDAAKRAFDNKSATVHQLQYSAIRHANLETHSSGWHAEKEKVVYTIC